MRNWKFNNKTRRAKCKPRVGQSYPFSKTLRWWVNSNPCSPKSTSSWFSSRRCKAAISWRPVLLCQSIRTVKVLCRSSLKIVMRSTVASSKGSAAISCNNMQSKSVWTGTVKAAKSTKSILGWVNGKSITFARSKSWGGNWRSTKSKTRFRKIRLISLSSFSLLCKTVAYLSMSCMNSKVSKIFKLSDLMK